MPNSYDLHGKSVIVTGGAKGIGRAISELMVSSGAKVRIWDANTAEVTGASSDIVDITDPAAIEAALSRLPDAETPDILVNNAGYLGTTQGFVEHPSEDWQRILAAAADRDRQATRERQHVFEWSSELTRCKGVVHASHARKRQGLLSRDSRYRRPSLSRLLPSSCRVAESTARRWYSRL